MDEYWADRLAASGELVDGAVIGLVEMQPVERCLLFKDPSRGDEANWRSTLAEMNQVPESDVRDIAFVDVDGMECVSYKIAVHYERWTPQAPVRLP